MGKLKLEGEMKVDSKQALESTEKQAKKSFDGIEKEAKDAEKETSASFEKMNESAKKRFGAIKATALAMFGAIGAAAGAIFAGAKLAEAGANVVAGMDTIKALGVSAQGLDKINEALQGTVDKLTIATSLRGAAISGLGEGQLANLAKTASFIAVKMGESKEETLKLAAAAQLSDDQLSQIGLSTLHLEAAIAKASADVGRTLSEREQRRVKLLTILKASARATNQFSADTKDAGDAAARTFAEFSNIKNELLREILPLVNSFLRKVIDLTKTARLAGQVLSKGAKGALESKQVDIFAQDVKKAFDGLRQDANTAIKYQTGSIDGAMRHLQQSLSRMAETVGPEAKTVFSKTFGTPEQAAAALAAWKKLEELQRKGALTAESTVKILDAMTRASGNMIKVNLKGVDAMREASEELRGFQSEARSLLRNYERTFAALLGSMGGTFSGVVSSLQDAFEKFRILGSLGPLREGLRKTLGLSLEQIEAQKTQLRLSDQQVKAAKLIAIARQAGELDRRERLGTEQSVNNTLRAGLSTLAAQQKIQQTLVEQFNQAKDVASSQVTVSRLRLALLARIAKLNENIESAESRRWRQTVIRLTLTRDFLQGQLERVSKTAAAYKLIAKERKGLLAIQMASARIELQAEIGKRALENEQKRVDSGNRLIRIQREIVALQERANPDLQVFQAARETVQGMAFELRDLQIQTVAVEKRLKVAFAFPKEKQLAQEQLATLKLTIANRQKEIDLIFKRASAQVAAQRRLRTEELAKSQLARAQALSAEFAKQAELRAQVSRAGFAQTPQSTVIQAAAEKLHALRSEIATLNLEASQLSRRLLEQRFATPEQQAELKGQLLVIQERMRLRKEEIGLVHMRRNAELQALTTIGAFQRQMWADAMNFSLNFANALKSGVDSAVSGLGTILVGVFEGLVTGADNLGQTVAKGFLDMLAGVAAQLGGFLLLAGTGLTAALIPSGAVAIGAGIGLLALAGTLKGLSSLLSAPPPSAVTATAPTISTPDRGLPGPNPVERDPRETFIAVISPDWNGTQEQQARRFFDWMQRNGRITRRSALRR